MVTPLPAATTPKEAPSSDCREQPSLDAEKVTLIQEYQKGIGTWVDLFDNDLNFTRTAVKRCRTSPLMMNAICALTARQLSMVGHGGDIWEAAAVRYYGWSLHHLINTFANTMSSPEDTLAATTLLSSYELLVSPVVDHRRHVSGALTLIRTYDCKATSKGLMGAAFWVYARQDVAMALVHERPTMLPPEKWGMEWAKKETAEDRLSNQLVWIIAKIIAFTYQGGQALSVDLLSQRRTALMSETQAWLDSLPASFHGILYGPPTPEGFVKYWFAVPLAGEDFLHLAHICWSYYLAN